MVSLPNVPELRWAIVAPSGHADGGGDSADSKGEVVEGATVYQRGCTRLPTVPATREQRWLIFPDGER
jgi:hypothetical protein